MGAPQPPCLPQEPRQPLRERCELALAIIPISYREWNTLYEINYGLVLVFEDEKEQEEAYYTPPSSPTPSLIEESHLVEIKEGLYIAMVDDEADVSALRTFDDEPFTHVVQVSYVTLPENGPPALSKWRREEAPRNALVQRLNLVCSAISHRHCAEKTAMDFEELKAARDFLTLALPHGNTKWWPEELRKDEQGDQSGRNQHDQQNEQDDDDDDNIQFAVLAADYGLDDLLNKQNGRVEEDEEVNVLIVAPTGRGADVLAVLFCYLAFLEGTTPKDLVDRDYRDEVWQKVVLEPLSMIYVGLVARHD
ncbi:hypothetical protein J3R82DRAFT_10969 [Butyriboletus roseoflavus]|nr:hypothetical protein J3R82DRAFT_10969 [Butyriboletus roseoflavus]